MHRVIDSVGRKQGKRGQNTWPVDLLVKGDVYVANQFGAKLMVLRSVIMLVMPFMQRVVMVLFMTGP